MIRILLFFLSINLVYGQTDSTVFTYTDFINQIKKEHPIIRQANLKPVFGQAELLKAKGSLDPKIESGNNVKNFDGKQYYKQFDANLSIPTTTGLKVVAGYENNSGYYLNPENTTASSGLYHVGLELDLLQGLIVNERQTALKKAEVFQNLAENERQILINEILYEATNAYLQWQLIYYFKNVFKDNIDNSATYFNSTKDSFLGGEKSAIDTLEAYIQLQDTELALNTNEMNLVKTKMVLENFLWLNSSPVKLQDLVIPEDLSIEELNSILADPALENIPSINASLNKLSMLEIDQKLKREKLKPKFKLKYNPLLSAPNNSPSFSMDNHKWGFAFSMPTFLRSERAELQQGNLKIQEQELEIENKKNQLENKISNSLSQIQLLKNQLILLEKNINNYKKLLEGEFEKFKFGESSTFLLNKRQEKYITARLKLIETTIKCNKEQLNYLYYTNQLVD